MGHPIVSCICITQNRRLFLRRATEYFLRAYSRAYWRAVDSGTCELVILDGSQAINREFDPVVKWRAIAGSSIRYFHEPSEPHTKTGALHNRACELARGDIIIQWDDDDWQAPDRIVKQVAALDRVGAPAFAYTSQFYWYHLSAARAARSRTFGFGGGSVGATFAYHKKLWEAHPFRDVELGEDNWFWQDLATGGLPMVDMKDPTFVVYIRHNRNGSYATTDQFTEEDTQKTRVLLDGDLPFYDELSEILPLDQWNNPHARWREPMMRTEIYRLPYRKRF